VSEDWCKNIEEKLDIINDKVSRLQAVYDNQANLMKYVITPLIAIVGVIVGIKVLV
jgi:hypothetical protein